MASAARRKPYGSFDPVGASPSPKQPTMVSSRSAMPIAAPRIARGQAILGATRGR